MTTPNQLGVLHVDKAEAESLLGKKLSSYREQEKNESYGDSTRAVDCWPEDKEVQLMVYCKGPITRQGSQLIDCPDVKAGIYANKNADERETKVGDEQDPAVVADVIEKLTRRERLEDIEQTTLQLVRRELEGEQNRG